MNRRDELIAFLDDLLESPGRPDYGPNGLQVPGAEEVELVVTGVSAHRELFEQAAAAGAQLVLCHHGIFWGEEAGPITEIDLPGPQGAPVLSSSLPTSSRTV